MLAFLMLAACRLANIVDAVSDTVSDLISAGINHIVGVGAGASSSPLAAGCVGQAVGLGLGGYKCQANSKH